MSKRHDQNSGTRTVREAHRFDERRLFDYLVRQAQMRHAQVQSGRFGADMQVSLLNDGPVTFWLEVNPN